MKAECYDTDVCGVPVRVILDHATACDIVITAGHATPIIASGYNTATLQFRLTDGTPAMCINQSGWARRASDDEGDVNGCLVLMIRDGMALTDEEAAQLFERVHRTLEREPHHSHTLTP